MIECVPGSGPVSDPTAEIEYVGGPRRGEREERRLRPAVIEAEGGEYARSVACADDGVLRYVWRPGAASRTPEEGA
jgi:hypothetical protein